VIGKTKDTGWEIGVSKTIPYSVDEVWDPMTSPAGIALWLGPGADLRAGAAYKTDDGTTGEVRGYRERDRVRVTWLLADADHETTVQFTVSPSGTNTVLRFYQERMTGPEELERHRAHWQGVLASVIDALGNTLGNNSLGNR
jgi:uncharacterized protein YndB with AHSA1/START domain